MRGVAVHEQVQGIGMIEETHQQYLKLIAGVEALKGAILFLDDSLVMPIMATSAAPTAAALARPHSSACVLGAEFPSISRVMARRRLREERNDPLSPGAAAIGEILLRHSLSELRAWANAHADARELWGRATDHQHARVLHAGRHAEGCWGASAYASVSDYRRMRLLCAWRGWRAVSTRSTRHAALAHRLSTQGTFIRWHAYALFRIRLCQHAKVATALCTRTSLTWTLKRLRSWTRRVHAWRRRLQRRVDAIDGLSRLHLPCMRAFDARAVFVEEGSAVMANVYRARRIKATCFCSWAAAMYGGIGSSAAVVEV